ATVTVTIANTGGTAATNFRLDSVFAGSGPLSCGVTGDVTSTISSLAAGASQTFSYPFNLPSLSAVYTARSFVDSQCVVAESNESNNQGTAGYTVLAASQIAVSPASQNYGSVTVGQSADGVFVL